jgi:hypothetical protein
MFRQIVIEAEKLGDSRTMFSLRIGTNVISEELTAEQARLLVGTILERIALPRPVESRNSRGSASKWGERIRGQPSSSICTMWALPSSAAKQRPRQALDSANHSRT